MGLKDFNPMWSFPTTSVSQSWDHITFGMDASHLKDDPGHAKDALISQSPIVVFKAATVLHSLVIASRSVLRQLLPSSDVKGEKKNRTYCPTTWNYAYVYEVSSKSPSHPQCAFGDSEPRVLSGLMVSLTPVHKAKFPRPIQLSQPVEFDSIEQGLE